MRSDDGRALADAINALRRIRAVERTSDEAGLREVWHHCPQGADLLSLVDGDGHLVRQELTLMGDFVRWVGRDGLSTGTTGEAPGSQAAKATDSLVLDRTPSPTRVMRAFTALAAYAGDDRYLLHLREVLQHALNGLEWTDTPTVTRVRPPPPAPDRRPRRARLGALWVAAALALAGAAVFLLWNGGGAQPVILASPRR